MSLYNSSNYSSCFSILVVLGFLILNTYSCQKKSIRVYRIPKDFLVTPQKTDLLRNWRPPSGWQEQTPTQIRIKSFIIPNEKTKTVGDFGIISMPAGGTRMIDNLNLWRSELKLSSIQPGDERNLIQEININSTPIFIADFESKELLLSDRWKERIFVAFFSHNNQQYFFKIRGDSELVSQEKDRLLKTLEEIQF